jgi:hypothetical protein
LGDLPGLAHAKGDLVASVRALCLQAFASPQFCWQKQSKFPGTQVVSLDKKLLAKYVQGFVDHHVPYDEAELLPWLQPQGQIPSLPILPHLCDTQANHKPGQPYRETADVTKLCFDWQAWTRPVCHVQSLRNLQFVWSV